MSVVKPRSWVLGICVINTILYKIFPDIYDDVRDMGWSYVLGNKFYFVRLVFNHIKWFFQRLYRGWDERNLWSLDVALAKWLLPQLEAFRKNLHGYPHGITEREWDKILDKIIWSFSYVADKTPEQDEVYTMISKSVDGIEVKDKKLHKKATRKLDNLEIRYQEGIDLFSKWFRNLWD